MALFARRALSLGNSRCAWMTVVRSETTEKEIENKKEEKEAEKKEEKEIETKKEIEKKGDDKSDQNGSLPKLPYWDSAEKRIRVKSFDEIPGPKPIFPFGNLWRYLPVIGQYSFLKLYETYDSFFKQYGYVVKEEVHPTRTIVHLFHPEDIMSIFQNPGKYPLRKSHSGIERYRRERPHLYSSAGLGPSNGEEWARFRHMFLNVGSHGIIFSRRSAVETATDDLVEKINLSLDENGETDIRIPLFRWALETVGLVTLDRRLGCLDTKKNEEADKLIEAAHATHDAIYQIENHLSPFLYWRQYRRLVKAQDYFAEVIRKHLLQSIEDSHAKPKCLVNTLLDRNEDATIQDVCTLILDLFQGGIHTVSYTLCFALLELAKNKEEQDKVRRLVIEKIPTLKSRLSDSHPVKYLTNIVSETLRLHPPTIGTGRLLSQDMVLGGYNVPAGTMVILQNQVASLNEKFFKDAHLFKPERWSSTKDFGVHDPIGVFASQPFGKGRRACIGSGLARMEMNLALGKIIRNFEISYHHEPVGIVNKLHNEPDKPVRLRLKKILQ